MERTYINYLKAEKKSEKTIDNYVFAITKCLNYINKPDTAITTADLYDWRGSIAHLAPATINNRTEAIKSYFKYLKAVDIISKDPSESLGKVKDNPKVKPYMTAEDAKKLITSASNYRDKAMIALMVSTGVRISELASITLEEYNQMKANGNKTIVILGKGNKERAIYINDMTESYIDNYLKTRTYSGSTLFCSNRGACVKTNVVDEMLAKTAKKAGLDYHISAHCLRAGFATIANANGATTADIANALGHSGLGVVQRYLKTSQRQIENISKGIAF